MIDAELLHHIEPSLEQAYDEHMASVAGKRPLQPSDILARSAQSDTRDPLDYGPLFRDNHVGHLADMEQTLGVDPREVLAASFLINLLTEDNLPHYTGRLQKVGGASSALTIFTSEWTAEEDAHGVLMRDYATLAGIIGTIDAAVITPNDYEQGRISQLQTGTEINPENLQQAFAYLTLQEHLTKEAHNKLSWLLPSMGRKVMRPISGDEQNHYEFYKKALTASLDTDPDGTLIAMNTVFGEFAMPGRLGIPNFDNHALTIGTSGIFDLESIARSKRTIIDKLNIADVEPQTDEAKAAQDQLLRSSSDKAIAAQKRIMESLRDNQLKAHDGPLRPFILGRTVEFKYVGAPGHQRPVGLKAITWLCLRLATACKSSVADT